MESKLFAAESAWANDINRPVICCLGLRVQVGRAWANDTGDDGNLEGCT